MGRNIQAIYDGLVSQLGLAWPSLGDARLSGQDPVVDSVFRLGECAASALAAQAAGVAEIWARRTGQRQTFSINALAGGLATFSVGYQSQHGFAIPQPEPSYPLVGFYPTLDQRWILLHGAYPLLRNGLNALLDCTMEPADIANKVAGWNGFELEQAIADRGLCGAVARSRAEWLDHPQGRAVAATPLIEIIKIADSAPEPFSPITPGKGGRPLDGVKILDLTHVIAGPTIGKTLAEQGAQVMHITTPTQPSLPPFVVDTGHGKQEALLTLTEPQDAATLRGLVPQSDVLVESYRPGAIAKLGFSPQELARLRPGMITCSVNCYGWDGPWQYRPGWEQLAQVVTGMTELQGTPDQPKLQSVYPNDYVTGFLGALGVLMALLRRAEEGGSYHVRVSLCRTAMWMLDQGEVDRSLLPPPPMPASILDKYLITEQNPAYGALTYLGPVLDYEKTPSRWTRPTLPLGAGPARWIETIAGAEANGSVSPHRTARMPVLTAVGLP